MKIPLNIQLPSRFMGNYFCIIPGSDTAFVVISKNSCTFLKKVALYNENGVWPRGFDAIHNKIGYSEESKYLVSVANMRDFEKKNGKLTKIAVWRDPIERVISTYKLFCLEREYRSYFHFLGINEDVPFGRFMEFLRFEWAKQNPMMQDEHIRRQVDYFDPEQVDHIIPIEKVNDFLQEQGIKFIKQRSNQTNVHFSIESTDFVNEIKTYYEQDYNIPLTYI